MTTDTVEAAEPATTPAPVAEPAGAGPRRVPPRIWLGFRRFRRTRPFWGAVILLFGAYCIANPIVGGGFAFVVDIGAKALTPLLLAFGMAAAALVAVVLPGQRHFPAIVAMALSVASLPLANLGGWIIGMAAGIVGSGLIFGWTPYSDKQLAKLAAKAERKAQRKAQRAAGRSRRRYSAHAGADGPAGD